MTEQKRRGRPPKANPEDLSGLVREVTAAMPRLSMDDPAVASVVAELTGDKTSAAQAYADRVWAGQSISALRSWRIERVKAALEGQGLPFDGVELPE